MQNVIVGAEAWLTAVQHIRDATADTQVLSACKLVGKCPHDKVREDTLAFLWQATSGLVALTGSEYIAQVRKMPKWHLVKMLHEMACMPGMPSTTYTRLTSTSISCIRQTVTASLFCVSICQQHFTTKRA